MNETTLEIVFKAIDEGDVARLEQIASDIDFTGSYVKKTDGQYNPNYPLPLLAHAFLSKRDDVFRFFLQRSKLDLIVSEDNSFIFKVLERYAGGYIDNLLPDILNNITFNEVGFISNNRKVLLIEAVALAKLNYRLNHPESEERLQPFNLLLIEAMMRGDIATVVKLSQTLKSSKALKNKLLDYPPYLHISQMDPDNEISDEAINEISDEAINKLSDQLVLSPKHLEEYFNLCQRQWPLKLSQKTLDVLQTLYDEKVITYSTVREFEDYFNQKSESHNAELLAKKCAEMDFAPEDIPDILKKYMIFSATERSAIDSLQTLTATLQYNLGKLDSPFVNSNLFFNSSFKANNDETSEKKLAHLQERANKYHPINFYNFVKPENQEKAVEAMINKPDILPAVCCLFIHADTEKIVRQNIIDLIKAYEDKKNLLEAESELVGEEESVDISVVTDPINELRAEIAEVKNQNTQLLKQNAEMMKLLQQLLSHSLRPDQEDGNKPDPSSKSRFKL